MVEGITVKKFIEFWGEGGYRQGFDKDYDYLQEIVSVLDEFCNKTALDIGCGNGYWTNRFLVQRAFSRIIAVDIIERPKGLDKAVEYIKCEDYSLPGVRSDSIDFVWSFGVFCHFTNKAVGEYLKSVCRVMKPLATGIIMFANWSRHPDFKERKATYGTDPEPFCGWTCADLETTRRQIREAGLTYIGERIENFRDTLAAFRKV